MRAWTIFAIGLSAAAVAGCAEFVLDIRAPTSELSATRALGASPSLSLLDTIKSSRGFARWRGSAPRSFLRRRQAKYGS
jgi:hypothetical protein